MLIPKAGIALRGLFIINPAGVVQQARARSRRRSLTRGDARQRAAARARRRSDRGLNPRSISHNPQPANQTHGPPKPSNIPPPPPLPIKNQKQVTINDLPIGRSVDETLRLLQAIQFHAAHGEVCPAGARAHARAACAAVATALSYSRRRPCGAAAANDNASVSLGRRLPLILPCPASLSSPYNNKTNQQTNVCATRGHPGWQPGDKGMAADAEKSLEYFQVRGVFWGVVRGVARGFERVLGGCMREERAGRACH